MATQIFHFSNTGISSGQRFYLKDEVSGIFLRNLNINSNFPIFGSNLVYNTGSQTINGLKTFTSGIDIHSGISSQSIRIFNRTGLNTGEFGLFGWQNNNLIIGPQQTNSGILRDLTLTGNNININASGVFNIFDNTNIVGNLNVTGNILLSGNPVLTGVDLSSYATIVNLANTGSTLNNSINALSGTLTSNYATISNLVSTGSTLQTQINNLGNTYATITNLASTGSTLDTKINNLSGVSVLTFGNQTISGNKTFTNNIIYSVSPRISGTNFTPNADLYTFFDYILTGNSILNEPTNMTNGESITIFLNQDANGSRSMNFNSAYLFSNGITPTLNFVPSGVDIMQVIRVNNKYFTTFASNYQ